MLDAAALHAGLLTLDTHIDIPWPDVGDAFGPSGRRVDLAKMRAGGLRAGCFAAYVPQEVSLADELIAERRAEAARE